MSDSESLVDRTRPDDWSEIQGNTKALKKIRKWCENWEKGDSPVLLHGDAGTGKTSTAYVIRDYMDWPLHQVNASSSRKSEDIEQIASAIQSNPYNSEHQLVLLDEVDSQSSSADLQPLYDALSDPPNPIILTANDEYSIPSGIKRKCTLYEFKLQKRSRKAKLKKIVEEEDIDVSPSDIARLAERPDLRSAINDLQMVAEYDGDVGFDDREWEQSEFEAVDEILSGDGDAHIAYNIDPSDFLFWLDENWRSNSSSNEKNIRGLEVAVAFDALSRSDKYLDRAFSTQNFRYKKYAGDLQRAIGDARLTEPYGSWIDKSFPKWWRSKKKAHDDGTGESKLYQKLDRQDRGVFKIGGDYTYFRRVLLPLLQEFPKEERLQLAVDHGVRDEKALNVLDIEESEFEEWKGEADWEESTMGSNAMDW